MKLMNENNSKTNFKARNKTSSKLYRHSFLLNFIRSLNKDEIESQHKSLLKSYKAET